MGEAIINVGGAIISVVPMLVLFWDYIFMSTIIPCVFHTSSAMDFTLFLYKGAKLPLSNDVVKSMALCYVPSWP